MNDKQSQKPKREKLLIITQWSFYISIQMLLYHFWFGLFDLPDMDGELVAGVIILGGISVSLISFLLLFLFYKISNLFRVVIKEDKKFNKYMNVGCGGSFFAMPLYGLLRVAIKTPGKALLLVLSIAGLLFLFFVGVYLSFELPEVLNRILPPKGFSITKKCSVCNKRVSRKSKKGDTCPHCGTIWGDEIDLRL